MRIIELVEYKKRAKFLLQNLGNPSHKVTLNPNVMYFGIGELRNIVDTALTQWWRLLKPRKKAKRRGRRLRSAPIAIFFPERSSSHELGNKGTPPHLHGIVDIKSERYARSFEIDFQEHFKLAAQEFNADAFVQAEVDIERWDPRQGDRWIDYMLKNYGKEYDYDDLVIWKESHKKNS